jgi:hypothetical protein
MTRAALAIWAFASALWIVTAGCNDDPRSFARTNTGAGDAAEIPAETDSPQPEPEVSSSEKSDAQSKTKATRARPDQSAEPAPSTRPAASARGKSVREISFDTIKFDIDKGQSFERSMLTPEIEKLEGARIRIRGYMLPSFQQSGIKQFVLVRDNMECCFGPGAALFDCVIVEMTGEATCEFSVRPIAVEGTFTIREFRGPDDMHLAIYHLDAERVR